MKTKRYILLFSALFLLSLGIGTTITAQISQSPQSVSLSEKRQTAARKFDEYGKIPLKDENARLDAFVQEMKNDAMAKGYIISYGGRKSRAKDALTMANKAKGYAVKKGKLKTLRIVTINGGYKEEPTTELWIVPSGAAAPVVSPTVDASEVIPAKVAVKAKSTKAKKKKSTKRKA